MQVHIQTKLPGSQTPEWIIIELQGDLESRTEDTMQSKIIGDLHFTKMGIPILIIGHHILYGKVLDMEKPLVAIKKEESTSLNEEFKSINYSVVSIIKKKLLFKARPKPIIVNNPKIS